MALISGGILVLIWILEHDFSGHYNRLALISVDIISGVYCIGYMDIKFHDVIRTKTSLYLTFERFHMLFVGQNKRLKRFHFCSKPRYF